MKKEKLYNLIFCIFLMLFFVFLFIFNSTLDFKIPDDAKVGAEFEKAEVVSILSDTQQPDPEFDYIQIGIQTIEFKVLTGSQAGKMVTTKNYIGRVDNKPAKVGTKMILASYDDFVTATVENYSRENVLYILALLFFALVVFFGKRKGLKSIFSLAFTLVTILFLFIPMIIKGVNPILASLTIVIISTVVTLFSLNGFGKKTIVAGVSCICCTAFAGLIALLVGQVVNISTLNTSEAEDLLFIAAKTPLRIHDLIFAGILIASLGAIMDTTMSITSSIAEMKLLNPAITQRQLFTSGMNIGKDIMGTMTNTLILAFTGSSINILVIYYMYQMQYLQMINIDLLVVEIIQGLSGSIAVILSIPITTLVSAKVFSNERFRWTGLLTMKNQ